MKKTLLLTRYLTMLSLLVGAITLSGCIGSSSEEESSTIGKNLIEVENGLVKMDVTQDANSFKILSNLNWTISGDGLTISPDGSASGGWFTINATSGKGDREVYVTTQANTTGEMRKALLDISSKYNDVQVLIRQAADNDEVLVVDKTTLDKFGAAGGESQTFEITALFPWTITADGLSGTDGGWYTLSSTSGSGDATITVTSKKNVSGQENNAELTITSQTGKTKTVKISQFTTAELEVTSDIPVFYAYTNLELQDPPLQTATLTVSHAGLSNAWSVSSDKTWLRATKVSETEIALECDDYITIGKRPEVATLTFDDVNLDAPVTYTIEQYGTPAFTDIKAGTYTATGTPRYLQTPDAPTFSGNIIPIEDSGEQYYGITRFSGRNLNIFVNYYAQYNGLMEIDIVSKLADTGSGVIGYLRMGYYDPIEGVSIFPEATLLPIWKEDLQTLDFSGTYNGNQIVIGVGGYGNNGTGSFVGAFTDMYEGLQFQISPTTGRVSGMSYNRVIPASNVAANGVIMPGKVKITEVDFDPALLKRR